MPSGQAFGIVGVNNGLANQANPCLGSQLTWAASSSGITKQPKTQLYVNTANPGTVGSTSWPTNNLDPTGADVTTTDPYGACNGSNSLSCSWQYGWNRAVQDVNQFLDPVAVDTFASDYTWWLDVETGNTWETGTAGLANNAADLQGMVSYLNSRSATNIGIYSTSYQWDKIVGTAGAVQSPVTLASWIPGAKNQKTAQTNCNLAPITPGGRVVLTQFPSGSFDADYSCI